MFSWAGIRLSQEREQESWELVQIFCPDLTAGTYLQHKDFFVIAGCLQNLTQKTDVYYIFLHQTVTKHALLLVQILLLPIETNVSSSSVVGTVCQIAAFFFLLSVDSLTPSLAGCCPNSRGCQGHCKVGQIRNPPLRRDKKLVRVRVSGDERDLAKLFWVLLLFFGWWGGRQETQSVT